jgi:putative transposase
MDTSAFFRPGNYYLIFNHSNGGEVIFKRHENYFYFMKKHDEYMDETWQLISWCILPESYVLLVRVKENFHGMHWKEINKLIYSRFGNFTNAYAKAINKSFSRKGSVFAKKFKRTQLTKDHIKKEILNIHLLPVKHQLASSPFDWQFSSCNKVHAYTHDPQLMHMLSFFENAESFISLHSAKENLNVAA